MAAASGSVHRRAEVEPGHGHDLVQQLQPERTPVRRMRQHHLDRRLTHPLSRPATTQRSRCAVNACGENGAPATMIGT